MSGQRSKGIFYIVNLVERLSTLVSKVRKKEEAIESKVEKAHFKLKSDGSLAPQNATAQNQVNKKIHIESGQDTPEWVVHRNIRAEQMRAANPNMPQEKLDDLLDSMADCNPPKESWSNIKTSLVTGVAVAGVAWGIGSGIPTLEGNLAASESFGYKPGDAPFTLNISHPVMDMIEGLASGDNDAKSLATDKYVGGLTAKATQVFNRTDEHGNVKQVERTARERVKEAMHRVGHPGLMESLEKAPVKEKDLTNKNAELETTKAHADAINYEAEATARMVNVYKNRARMEPQ